MNFIEGLGFVEIDDADCPLPVDLECCRITPMGIEYLCDNSFMAKVQKFVKEAKDIISPFIWKKASWKGCFFYARLRLACDLLASYRQVKKSCIFNALRPFSWGHEKDNQVKKQLVRKAYRLLFNIMKGDTNRDWSYHDSKRSYYTRWRFWLLFSLSHGLRQRSALKSLLKFRSGQLLSSKRQKWFTKNPHGRSQEKVCW